MEQKGFSAKARRHGFTLVELLVVIAILGIIAAIIVLQIDPLELINRARDSQRIEALDKLRGVILSATAYDPTFSLCSGVKPPCVGYSNNTDSSIRNLDGTGWVKANLASNTAITLSTLLVDPVNDASHYFTYYSDGRDWEIDAVLESKQMKKKMAEDGGDNDNAYEVGSSLLVLSDFVPGASIPVLTTLPSGAPTFVPTVSPPSGGPLDQPQTIKVLVLNYFPLNPNDNTRLDGTKMGPDFANVTLTNIRTIANSEVQNLVTSLKEASKFRGYKNGGATAYLNFTIIGNKEYLKPIPNSTFNAWYKPGVYRPDLRKMLQGEDFNICDYVDNQGVTQVWFRGYQYADMEPDESNMSMGTSSRSFWNWGTYGDISNSQHFNDMPVCNKTYTLLGYGGLGNTLENHLHQTENLFIFADFASNSEKLFRKMPEDNSVGHDTFERPVGLGGGAVNHCGNVHNPPNSTIAYDWFNETTVKSDCMDWKPDGGGQVTDVNCHTWYPGVAGSCRPVDDGGAKFKIWLMQNYAGYQNTLTYQGKRLRNWWEFYADFDAALARGKSLTVQTSVLGVNSSVFDNFDFSSIVHFIQSLLN